MPRYWTASITDTTPLQTRRRQPCPEPPPINRPASHRLPAEIRSSTAAAVAKHGAAVDLREGPELYGQPAQRLRRRQVDARQDLIVNIADELPLDSTQNRSTRLK